MAKCREDFMAKYEDEKLHITNSIINIHAQVKAEIKSIEDQISNIKTDKSRYIKVLEE